MASNTPSAPERPLPGIDDLRFIGTPKQLFIVNPSYPKEINTDALTCALKRARAVLLLL